MTMLEKAARRACESFPARGGRVCDYPDCGCAALAEQAARNLLTVIRELDEAIISAARSRHPYDYDVAESWPVMIDAILKEPK